ncbi:unnamed protein product [Citrullus colocynthis]|uniref:Uncharacterized protein n=1 Tax=Citrullus colocynthis TaxID=252529 RepID=A0ABP0YWL2_9ROSI
MVFNFWSKLNNFIYDMSRTFDLNPSTEKPRDYFLPQGRLKFGFTRLPQFALDLKFVLFCLCLLISLAIA